MPTQPAANWPVSRSLTPFFILSILIALLLAAVSAAGLLYGVAVYETDKLRLTFRLTDVVGLVVTMPVLLGAAWLARRGSLAGLLAWPGALIFVLYNALVYVVTMPVNAALVAQLVLVVLSTYTLIGLMPSLDGKALQQRLSGAVHERIAALSLAGQGAMTLLWVGLAFVDTIGRGTPMAATALATHISDGLTTPAWIIIGGLLWRRQALGYMAGLGLLLQGCLFAAAMAVMALVQMSWIGVPVSVAGVGMIVTAGLINVVPFGLWVHGMGAKRTTTRTPLAQPG